MDEIVECPNCLGIKEEYNKRTKKVRPCTLCNGEGVVDEVISDAYLNNYIPNYGI